MCLPKLNSNIQQLLRPFSVTRWKHRVSGETPQNAPSWCQGEIYRWKYAKGQRPNLMSRVLSTSREPQPLSQQYWFAATDPHDMDMSLETKVRHNHMILQAVRSSVKCLHKETFWGFSFNWGGQSWWCRTKKIFYRNYNQMLHKVTQSALLCSSWSLTHCLAWSITA